MRSVPTVSKRTLVAQVITSLIVVAALSAGFGTVQTSAVAFAAPDSTCTAYWTPNTAYGYWDAAYGTQGLSTCSSAPPEGQGWIYACSNSVVTANMDVWLSQSIVRGDPRLAESGRTGNKSWDPDCQWHNQVYVDGWGQYFTTPLWACLWTQDLTVNLTFNYLCAQAY